MINLKIGIHFTIRNLTEFNWPDLQEDAQRLADKHQFHTVPYDYYQKDGETITHGDQDISVFIRRDVDSLEFLFIQKSLFGLGNVNPPPQEERR